MSSEFSGAVVEETNSLAPSNSREKKQESKPVSQQTCEEITTQDKSYFFWWDHKSGSLDSIGSSEGLSQRPKSSMQTTCNPQSQPSKAFHSANMHINDETGNERTDDETISTKGKEGNIANQVAQVVESNNVLATFMVPSDSYVRSKLPLTTKKSETALTGKKAEKKAKKNSIYTTLVSNQKPYSKEFGPVSDANFLSSNQSVTKATLLNGASLNKLQRLNSSDKDSFGNISPIRKHSGSKVQTEKEFCSDQYYEDESCPEEKLSNMQSNNILQQDAPLKVQEDTNIRQELLNVITKINDLVILRRNQSPIEPSELAILTLQHKLQFLFEMCPTKQDSLTKSVQVAQKTIADFLRHNYSHRITRKTTMDHKKMQESGSPEFEHRKSVSHYTEHDVNHISNSNFYSRRLHLSNEIEFAVPYQMKEASSNVDRKSISAAITVASDESFRNINSAAAAMAFASSVITSSRKCSTQLRLSQMRRKMPKPKKKSRMYSPMCRRIKNVAPASIYRGDCLSEKQKAEKVRIMLLAARLNSTRRRKRVVHAAELAVIKAIS